MRLKNRTMNPGIRKGSVGSSRFFAILTISIGCLAIYLYAWFTAVPEYFGLAAVSMGFQLACWAFAWILLVHFSPGGYPRISDPAVLVLLWSGAYFIYPSVIWLQGQLYNTIGINTAVLLFWLHGLFISGFIFGHLIFRRSSSWAMPRLNIDNLPNGWLLYIVPVIIFLFWTIVRYMSRGVLFQDYGQNWYNVYSSAHKAMATGGFTYILTQILHKIYLYSTIIQGAGEGLIIIKMIHSRKHILRNLFIFGTIFLITLFLGFGARSGLIIIYLIGLILSDMIIGPFKWRYLFIIFFTGLAIFTFYGVFRGLTYSGQEKFTVAYDEFINNSVRQNDITEFSIMLLKEAQGITIFKSQDNEGIYYLVRSILEIIPSQLLPEKMDWQITSDILARNMEGPAYYEGQGVSGAIIVDGYRFAGEAGVPLLAFILGGFLGVFHNIMINYKRSSKELYILLGLGLMAGFYACCYELIRGDLGLLIITLVYYVIMPLIVINLIYRKRYKRYNYIDQRKHPLLLGRG